MVGSRGLMGAPSRPRYPLMRVEHRPEPRQQGAGIASAQPSAVLQRRDPDPTGVSLEDALQQAVDQLGDGLDDAVVAEQAAQQAAVATAMAVAAEHPVQQAAAEGRAGSLAMASWAFEA